jgi:hypothetical protein
MPGFFNTTLGFTEGKTCFCLFLRPIDNSLPCWSLPFFATISPKHVPSKRLTSDFFIAIIAGSQGQFSLFHIKQ